jgi:hypothetical protein
MDCVSYPLTVSLISYGYSRNVQVSARLRHGAKARPCWLHFALHLTTPLPHRVALLPHTCLFIQVMTTLVKHLLAVGRVNSWFYLPEACTHFVSFGMGRPNRKADIAEVGKHRWAELSMHGKL